MVLGISNKGDTLRFYKHHLNTVKMLGNNLSVSTSENTTINWMANETDREYNYSPIITEEVFNSFVFICYGFVIPIICVCGITGNSMAIPVLYMTVRQFKHSIYLYMCALTIYDTLYMILNFAISVSIIIKNTNEKIYSLIYRHFFIAFIFTDILLAQLSVSVLILMSVERFLAIHSPLKVKDSLIAKRPFFFLAASFVFVTLLSVPIPVCMQMTEIPVNENQTRYQITIKKSLSEFFEYYHILQAILMDYVPFVTILGFNIAIPIRYFIAVRKRRFILKDDANTPGDQNMRVLGTVFLITMSYTILILPHMCAITLFIVDNRFSIRGPEKYLYLLLADVNNALTNLNMAIDFVIYILMSKVYRKRFINIFCKGMCNPKGRGLDNIDDIRSGQPSLSASDIQDKCSTPRRI